MKVDDYYIDNLNDFKELAFSICKGKEYHNDLVQEVYMRIAGREAEDPKAYICRTIYNVAKDDKFIKDFLHWENKRTDLIEGDWLEDIQPKINLEKVHIIARRLTKYERLLFYSFMDGSISFRDAAKAMGLSFKTLYNDYNKVKQKIQRELTKDAYK